MESHREPLLTRDPSRFAVLLALGCLASVLDGGVNHKLRAADQAAPGGAQSLTGVGDVDGDGYDDVLIGISGLDNQTGAAFLYFGDGSAGGIDGSRKDRLDLADGAPGDALGAAVANPGDLDGDGFSDAALLAPGRRSVVLWFGSAQGGAGVIELALPAGGSLAGAVLAAPGDLTGDGWVELAVGLPDSDQVVIFLGGPSGPEGTTVTLFGAPGDRFGAQLAGLHLDADGIVDLAVGAPGVGRVATFLGGEDQPLPSTPLVGTGDDGAALAPADFNGDGQAELVVGGADSGRPVLLAADLDGDGRDELVIGQPDDQGVGRVVLAWGGDEGDTTILVATDGDPGDRFGEALTAVDVNADGVVDLLVGAGGADDNGEDSGSVYLFLGVPPPVEPEPDPRVVTGERSPGTLDPTDQEPASNPAGDAGCGCSAGLVSGRRAPLFPVVLALCASLAWLRQPGR